VGASFGCRGAFAREFGALAGEFGALAGLL